MRVPPAGNMCETFDAFSRLSPVPAALLSRKNRVQYREKLLAALKGLSFFFPWKGFSLYSFHLETKKKFK
jgi:hypothetical protein